MASIRLGRVHTSSESEAVQRQSDDCLSRKRRDCLFLFNKVNVSPLLFD